MAYDPTADNKQYVLTNMLDNIESGASNTMKFLNEKMADDPDRWDDDVWRFMGQRIGGALIGGGVGSFGGPKGTIGGAIVGGVMGFDNSAKLLGSIPGMSQLGRFQDATADGARHINEKLTPWLDPRVAGWGSRVVTDYLLERGVRSGTRAITKGVKAYKAVSKADEIMATAKAKDVGILAQMGANADYGKRINEFDFIKKYPQLANDPVALETLEKAFARRLLGEQPDGYNYLGKFREIWNKSSRDAGFYHTLAEAPSTAYVEHMIAKGSWMDWFWNLPDKARFYRPGSRHSVENVRLLFNRRYESLKNTAEGIAYGKPWYPSLKRTVNWQRDPLKRIIIDIDDPMPKHGRIGYESVLERNTPGDIIFREVGTGDIKGRLGDYLDMIYAPVDELIPALIDNGIISKVTKKGRLKSKSGLVKSMRKWRKQVLNERINKILYPKQRTIKDTQLWSEDGIVELLDRYPFLEDLRQPGWTKATTDTQLDPRWLKQNKEFQYQEIVEELEEIKQILIGKTATERNLNALKEVEADLKRWKNTN